MKGKWLTIIICIMLLIFGITVAALVQKRAKIPDLIEQMGSAEWDDARDAMRELTTMRALVVGKVCEVLDPATGVRPDAERWRAAMVLGEIGGDRAVPVLRKALQEFDSKDVRWNCIVALGKLGATEAIGDLEEIFPDDSLDEIVRLTAIRTLGNLKAKDAVGPLIGQLKKRPDARQVEAERREDERKAKESAEKAEKRKQYEDAGLPVPADLLEEEVVEEEAPAEPTDADRPQLRIACCVALAMIGDNSDTVIDALSEAAGKDYEPDYAVRAAATAALADLAPPTNTEVVDVLLANLRDEQWDMNADDEDDDNDGDLRAEAAYALGRLGNKSESVIAELQRVQQNDKHYWAREAAAESLTKLGGRVESD